jgi:uncharacterized membrane protein
MAIETFKQKSKKKIHLKKQYMDKETPVITIPNTKKYVIYTLTIIGAIFILSILFIIDLNTYKHVKIGIPILMLIYLFGIIILTYVIKYPIMDKANIIIMFGLIVASIYVTKEYVYALSWTNLTARGLGALYLIPIIAVATVFMYTMKENQLMTELNAIPSAINKK